RSSPVPSGTPRMCCCGCGWPTGCRCPAWRRTGRPRRSGRSPTGCWTRPRTASVAPCSRCAAGCSPTRWSAISLFDDRDVEGVLVELALVGAQAGDDAEDDAEQRDDRPDDEAEDEADGDPADHADDRQEQLVVESGDRVRAGLRRLLTLYEQRDERGYPADGTYAE